MTPDTSNSVLNSELAVDVMCAIASSERGDYGSHLADELDKSQASIGRILKSLHDIGFIKKGTRERAQFYVMDYKGIADYWYNRVREEVDECDVEINKSLWLEEGSTSTAELREQFENNTEEVKNLVQAYMKRIMKHNPEDLEGYTVSNILFEGFAYAIGHNMIRNPKLASEFEHLEPMKDALVYFWNLHGYANELEEILEQKS